MIRKDHGELVCECDGCGTEKYGGTLNFQMFVEDIKDEGWKIRKDNGEWCHYCESCVEEMNE